MNTTISTKILEAYGQELLEGERAGGRVLFDSKKPRITSLSFHGRMPSYVKNYVVPNKRKGLGFKLRGYGKLLILFGETSYLKAMMLKWCYPAFKHYLDSSPSRERKAWFFKTIPLLPTIAVIVLNEKTEILLGVKSRKVLGSAERCISIPAGNMELNEDFEKAALREAKEEAGVDLELEKEGIAFMHPTIPTVVFTKIGKLRRWDPTNTDGEFEVLFFIPQKIITQYLKGNKKAYFAFLRKHKVNELELTPTARISLKEYFGIG